MEVNILQIDKPLKAVFKKPIYGQYEQVKLFPIQTANIPNEYKYLMLLVASALFSTDNANYFLVIKMKLE